MKRPELAGPIHYRLRDSANSDGVTINVDKWYPIAETPAGYWLVSQYDWDHYEWWSEISVKKSRRWAPKRDPQSRTPVMAVARLNFLNRKNTQLRKLQWQLEQCQQVHAGLKVLDDSPMPDEGFNCGTPAAWEGIRWE